MKPKQHFFLTLCGFALCIIFFNAFAANLSQHQATIRYQSFYQNASYQNFIDIITSFNKHDRYFQRRVPPQVFTTMVLKNNINYVKNISQDFNNFSSSIKQYLLAGLISAGYQSQAINLDKSNKISNKISFSLNADEIVKLKIADNADNFDKLAAAYFATGNSDFLKQMMIYLSTQSDYVLKKSYELNYYINRCSPDYQPPGQCPNDVVSLIKDEVKKEHPRNSSLLMQRIKISGQIIQGLDTMRDGSETIQNTLANIAASNPKLNYVKRLSRLFPH